MEVYGSHVIFANFIQNFVSNYVFKKNLWFSKKNLFRNNQKTIANTIQAKDFTYILYF